MAKTYKQQTRELSQLLDIANGEARRLRDVSAKQSKAIAGALYEKNQALAAVSAHRTRIIQESDRANAACDRNVQLLGLNTILNNRVNDLQRVIEEYKKAPKVVIRQPRFKAGDVVKVTQGGKTYGYFEVESSKLEDGVILYDFVNSSGYTGFSYNGTAEFYCELVAEAKKEEGDYADEN